ncbi:MAG: cyclic nucleotide-binding domain-containing protein [Proteobacteria bacterium]|nr:cyclic nucleotide-binding domain-containing protein [Pseudomonadota bacterium]
MSNISLSGNLNFLNLGELFQIFGTNSSTGVLKIKSKYSSDPGLMYFVKGNIVDASAGTKRGVDAAYALFGWIDGDYEFYQEEVNLKNVVQKSRMEITLDALRLLDDGQIEKLGPVSFEKKPSGSSDKQSAIPVIRGPLVDYAYVVDEEEHFDGNKIVEEGKYGNWMWTVLEGTVEIIKETDKGTVKILRLSDGSFIGSISAVMPGDRVRNASAKAVGTVQLGLLDSQRLYGEFTKLSSEMKEIIKSLDNRLQTQTTMMIDTYLNKINVKDILQNKKILIEQGSPNNKCYKITEGEVLIVRNTKNGYLPIVNLSAGDYIGQIPFINIGQEPHSASVLGSTNIKATAIETGNIQKEYDNLSLTFKNILENIGSCISATTMVASELHRKSSSS